MTGESGVDPMIGEVHRVRREYTAKFNDDLAAIFENVRKRQEEARKPGTASILAPLRRTEKPAEPAA